MVNSASAEFSVYTPGTPGVAGGADSPVGGTSRDKTRSVLEPGVRGQSPRKNFLSIENSKKSIQPLIGRLHFCALQ